MNHQPRNNRGQFTSSNKNANNAELNLSIISDDDDFEYYNKSEGKPVHTNLDDELQLLPKEANLTQGRYKDKKSTESVRSSNILPFARQTEKLGGVPYYTNNNKKKVTINGNLLQETAMETAERNEEENNHSIRKNIEEIRIIRSYRPSFRREGNLTSRQYYDLHNCRNIRI